MNLREIQRRCHNIAIDKGFWDKKPSTSKKKSVLRKNRNDAEMICLMHSELSEALEEIRNEKINWDNVEEELADCVIRICDYCGGRGLDLEMGIMKKIKKNKERPYKHGRKF